GTLVTLIAHTTPRSTTQRGYVGTNPNDPIVRFQNDLAVALGWQPSVLPQMTLSETAYQSKWFRLDLDGFSAERIAAAEAVVNNYKNDPTVRPGIYAIDYLWADMEGGKGKSSSIGLPSMILAYDPNCTKG